MTADRIMGTVVAGQANFYQVCLSPDQSPSGNGAGGEAKRMTLLCTCRARLKKIGQKVMVGDRVVVSCPDWQGGRGVISEILPRKTELARPSIANADHLLLVFAVAEPDPDPVTLSRFLLKAESTGLEVSLCFNKCDLLPPDSLREWYDRMRGWGYDPLMISVYHGVEYRFEGDRMETSPTLNLSSNSAGLDKPGFGESSPSLTRDGDRNQVSGTANSLLDRLRLKTTAISGPSGVGKSSLINKLIPNSHLRVGEVSGKLGRGRHTTRHVELFELHNGGFLADTPGFNQPELQCDPHQLGNYFPEIRDRLTKGKCQFDDCLHREEPSCVVRGDWERYPQYLHFLEEAIEAWETSQHQPLEEDRLKSKSKSGGGKQYEPKLQSKKYRRSSRRLEHQNLQQLCEDLDEV
ncbi:MULTISPECIES: ribosome small subunit-dependent GTPase A [Limnospira]|nr:ribosome small subunit-dependent GTPase A [Limnospira indica]